MIKQWTASKKSHDGKLSSHSSMKIDFQHGPNCPLRTGEHNQILRKRVHGHQTSKQSLSIVNSSNPGYECHCGVDPHNFKHKHRFEKGGKSAGKPFNRHVCKNHSPQYYFPEFKARQVIKPKEITIPKLPEKPIE